LSKYTLDFEDLSVVGDADTEFKLSVGSTAAPHRTGASSSKPRVYFLEYRILTRAPAPSTDWNQSFNRLEPNEKARIGFFGRFCSEKTEHQ